LSVRAISAEISGPTEEVSAVAALLEVSPSAPVVSLVVVSLVMVWLSVSLFAFSKPPAALCRERLSAALFCAWSLGGRLLELAAASAIRKPKSVRAAPSVLETEAALTRSTGVEARVLKEASPASSGPTGLSLSGTTVLADFDCIWGGCSAPVSGFRSLPLATGFFSAATFTRSTTDWFGAICLFVLLAVLCGASCAFCPLPGMIEILPGMPSLFSHGKAGDVANADPGSDCLPCLRTSVLFATVWRV